MAYQSEIEKLEQRYRENPDQWFAALADSYRKAGSLELALDVVKAGLDKRPNYVSGYIVLGRCLLQKPDDGAAALAFEKVLSLDAENVIALKALSEVSERSGRLADAVRWLGRLLEVDPMNDEAEQDLARLKQAVAALPAPPPPAPAGGAAEAAEVAEAGEGAPVRGFEATIPERPAAPEPTPVAEFAIEKSHGATEAPEPGVVSLEPLELEGVGPSVSSAASAAPPAGAVDGAGIGLEPREFEPPPAGEPVPAAAGVESMTFEPPPAAQVPPRAADLEPMEFTPPAAGEVVSSPAPVAEPFDDQLAWGTGQRVSGAISASDVVAAEQAHEPTLEPVVEDLPGTSAGDLPATAVEEPTPASGLPLIFPDEGAPAAGPSSREAEAPSGADPEPVVTETMAELYAKQGLLAEARDIYRKLAAQRPGDAAVNQRLNELEGAVVGRRPGVAARAAEARGGPSARDFLAGVFGGAPTTPSPFPVPPSPGGGGMGKGDGEPAPTRRASDEVSLAAVFGEEPRLVSQSSGPAQAPKPAGQGFSFDEFFGSKAPGASGQGEGEKGGEDEDDFKRWLKGLKS